MRQIKTFVILSAAAVLVACASQAPAPATATGRAVAPGTAVAAGQQSSNIPGYRRVVDNGREMFCRYEATTGSNIKTETCLTRAQIEQQQKDAQQQLQNALENSRTCTAGYGQGVAGGTCQP